MDRLVIRVEESEAGLLLRLDGILDGKTVRALAKTLEGLPPRPLTVDFSRVRTFVDLSVDALTQALRDRPVHLQGLGRHQQRMFRYFGFASEPMEEPAEA
jgi:STAS domain-containing protein